MIPTLPIHLLVLAKAPVPGLVKTRLIPDFTAPQAAALAEACLLDTLDAVRGSSFEKVTLVLAGSPGAWMPRWIQTIPQRDGGLDERLAGAFVDGGREGLPVLLIGMDTPQVSPARLRAVGRQLLADRTDAVIGLAPDGGWWTLGLRRPDPSLLLGVPTSTPATGRLQLDRLRAAGLTVKTVEMLTDVDTPADVAAVARSAPAGRFASTLRELRAS